MGSDVDDTAVPYAPLFADTWTIQGQQYFYRVRARNDAGASEPSNVVGPVRADGVTMVDDLADLTRSFAHAGVRLVTDDSARRRKT